MKAIQLTWNHPNKFVLFAFPENVAETTHTLYMVINGRITEKFSGIDEAKGKRITEGLRDRMEQTKARKMTRR
jgi:hypothetical protein